MTLTQSARREVHAEQSTLMGQRLINQQVGATCVMTPVDYHDGGQGGARARGGGSTAQLAAEYHDDTSQKILRGHGLASVAGIELARVAGIERTRAFV